MLKYSKYRQIELICHKFIDVKFTIRNAGVFMRKRLLRNYYDLNTFDFKPIGHGLFYTGSLLQGQYNFVFDCGTLNDREILEYQVEKYVYSLRSFYSSKKPTIDFVVISHLHIDHYKGLYFLLQKCDVKKIYLPYLGDDNYYLIRNTLLFSIYGNINELEDEDKDDDENYNLFSFMGTLYGVDRNDKFINYREKVTFINEQSNAEQRIVGDKLYTTLTDYFELNDKKYWQFSFIQSSVKLDKLYLLNKELKNAFGQLNNRQLIDNLRNDNNTVTKIKEIYESVFGTGNKLNLTSIMLVHFPLYLPKCCIFPRKYYIEEFITKFNLGIIRQSNLRPTTNCIVSLLTGDAKFDSIIASEIKSIISNREILMLQVPHHGSKENWNTVLNSNIKAYINVITCKCGSGHKLPHPSTIDYMIQNSVKYVLVTQVRAFRYTID